MNTEMTKDYLRSPAQRNLLDSEIHYRRLFELAPDGILVLDAVSGKIADVNSSMTQLLVYSREEFLGKRFGK